MFTFIYSAGEGIVVLPRKKREVAGMTRADAYIYTCSVVLLLLCAVDGRSGLPEVFFLFDAEGCVRYGVWGVGIFLV